MAKKRKCNTIKDTCGKKMSSECVDYEREVNECSDLDSNDCLTIADTTQDLFNQVQKIKDSLNLDELGNSCLTYDQLDPTKLEVKEALKGLEEKVCQLCELVPGATECNPIYDQIIDCVGLDFKCLTDPCNETISTLKELLQALIDQVCACCEDPNGGSTTTPTNTDTIQYTFQAWVDDTNTGNGFTVDPNTGSDRCYYAVRTVTQAVSATIPTNVFTDYSASDWTKVKEPKLQYEYGYNLSGNNITIPAATADMTSFNVGIPTLTIPATYIENSNSIAKFTFIWSYENLNDSTGRISLNGSLAGTNIVIANIEGALDGVGPTTIKTEVHVSYNATGNLDVAIMNVSGIGSQQFLGSFSNEIPNTTAIVYNGTTIPYTTGTDLVLDLSTVVAGEFIESSHEVVFYSALLEGFNPLKTIC